MTQSVDPCEDKLRSVRIVLVETSHPGNIGAVARAMKTMGLTQLYLLNPVEFPSPIAEARASGAIDLLESAHVISDLSEAIADCELVLGTSARRREIPWPMLSPKAAMQKAVQMDAPSALILGPERSGLTNDVLQRCDFHVEIPSNPEYCSLNLGSAAQIMAYEARLATEMADAPELALERPSQEAKDSFFEHLEQTLLDIDFLNPDYPKKIMPRLRRYFTRSEPDQEELRLLRGILTQVQKASD